MMSDELGGLASMHYQPSCPCLGYCMWICPMFPSKAICPALFQSC